MRKSLLSKLREDFSTGAQEDAGDSLSVDRHEGHASLPLDRIKPNPEQPRRHFSEEKHQELVLSIRERGVLQPIRVLEVKALEEYEIIAGERRWRAAREAGLAEIPAVIVRGQERAEAFLDALIENVIREDLNPIDRAEALVKLRFHLGGKSWEELAQTGKIGLQKSQIYNLLGLSSLPDPVKDDIRAGRLTEKHGRALRTLRKDPKLFDRAWNHMRTENVSGEDALSYVKSIKNKRAVNRTFKITYRTDLELIAALEEKLRELRANPKT